MRLLRDAEPDLRGWLRLGRLGRLHRHGGLRRGDDRDADVPVRRDGDAHMQCLLHLGTVERLWGRRVHARCDAELHDDLRLHGHADVLSVLYLGRVRAAGGDLQRAR